MKLGTFRIEGHPVAAVVIGDELAPLPAMFDDRDVDLVAVAASTDLQRQIAERLPTARRIARAGVTVLPPIANPGKIICVGVNYEDHRLEGGRPKAGYPTLFSRYAESLVGDGAAILRPVESQMLDYEGEIAIVIGRGGYRINAADALSHVFAYSCFNDASVRDWQRHTSQWMPGKNFMATGGFGPWLVTADEAGDPDDMVLTCRLNGEVMQQAPGRDMLFKMIPAVIEYVTSFTELKPGDVIATGTPGGVGFARDPQLFMKPGDVVEVEISGVGVLTNTITDAPR